MTILGLQRRIREIGRIRLGTQATTSTGKRAPRKLDKFRFTSPDRGVIEAVAALLGGSAQEWDNNGATHHEVFTETNEVKILLPPNPTDMAFSQYYETWAKGFCQRRCDGERETIRDRACICDPENRECKPTTRLSVLLPEIPGLGLWRLESHGYYAAVELAGAVELIGQMAGAHTMIPARLRLERREVRRLEGTKAVVRKFAVPVIDLDVSILGVRALAARTVEDLPEIEAGDGWAPVPEVEAPEVLSIESQVREHEEAKPRRTTQAPLPATGRPRRTAAEAQEQGCHLCSKPYGTEPVVLNPAKVGGRFVHKACLAAVDIHIDTPGQVLDETPAEAGEPSPTEPVADSRGGLPGDEPEASIAEPTPAVARTTKATTKASPTQPKVAPAQGDWPMTAGQHRKVMAMTAELFPYEGGGPEADTYRRECVLAICAQLGSPGLTSRADITRDTAKLLIDALTKLEARELAWDHEAECLVDPASGEIVRAEP